MDNVIDLGRLWLIVRRNITLMVVLGVAMAVVAFGVSKFVMHPKYSASAALLVNRKQDDQQGAIQYADQQADVQIINTYKDIITRPIILDSVVKELTEPHKVQTKAAVEAKYKTNALGEEIQTSPAEPAQYKLIKAKYAATDLTVDELARMISISNQTNSQVFSVNVKSGDPVLSKDIANTIADVFKDQVASIMSVSNVSIVSKATTNRTPVAPNVKLITLVGLVMGIAVGFIWGFIKEITDRTVKDLNFLTDDLKLTNLGVINYIGKMRDIKDAIAKNNEAANTDTSRISRLDHRI
ncbi:YveK family protein [Weissella confusa]|uniref:Capsular polysaccharide biosynthesis protein CpsC n=1 Tax=Weissella confusa TaxID=1583 RepID=A0AAJ2YWU4_WEICO|nr:Wzz/FepE/Etk N-terminal domain-containing protein [Weissella confusa]NBA11182.1 capsular biosynthesis protein [Weissella confusa]